MSEKIIEKKCGCGQVTHQVQSKDGLRYSAEKHGTDAVSDNRCFNCHQPLDKPKAAPAPAPAPATPAGPEAEEAASSVRTEDELWGMKQKELLALAQSTEFNLSLAKSSSKAAIIEAILDAQDQAGSDTE